MKKLLIADPEKLGYIDAFLRKCGSDLAGKSVEEIVKSFVHYLKGENGKT